MLVTIKLPGVTLVRYHVYVLVTLLSTVEFAVKVADSPVQTLLSPVMLVFVGVWFTVSTNPVLFVSLQTVFVELLITTK